MTQFFAGGIKVSISSIAYEAAGSGFVVRTDNGDVLPVSKQRQITPMSVRFVSSFWPPDNGLTNGLLIPGDTMQDALELKRLGEMFVEKGDYESAELLFRKAVVISEETAPDSVALSEDLYNLGLLCYALDKEAEARAFLMRAWQIERTLLGDTHVETLKTFNALNEVFYDQESINREGQLYSSNRPSKVTNRTYH